MAMSDSALARGSVRDELMRELDSLIAESLGETTESGLSGLSPADRHEIGAILANVKAWDGYKAEAEDISALFERTVAELGPGSLVPDGPELWLGPTVATVPSGSKAGVLVAAPTFKSKAYALDEFVSKVRAQDYAGPHDLLLVDNSRGTRSYADEIAKRGVAVAHIEPSEDWLTTHDRCLAIIARVAQAKGYRWVLSLEQDVFVGPEAIRKLVGIAENKGLRVVRHKYRPRESVLQASLAAGDIPAPYGGWQMVGMGLTLIETQLLVGSVRVARHVGEDWGVDG